MHVPSFNFSHMNWWWRLPRVDGENCHQSTINNVSATMKMIANFLLQWTDKKSKQSYHNVQQSTENYWYMMQSILQEMSRSIHLPKLRLLWIMSQYDDVMQQIHVEEETWHIDRIHIIKHMASWYLHVS